jgi:hypothetical protein
MKRRKIECENLYKQHESADDEECQIKPLCDTFESSLVRFSRDSRSVREAIRINRILEKGEFSKHAVALIGDKKSKAKRFEKNAEKCFAGDFYLDSDDKKCQTFQRALTKMKTQKGEKK